MRKINNIDSYKLDARPFLKIETKEVAYLLGFLWADGCVLYRPKHKSVKIALEIVAEDLYNIEDIIDSTGYWNKSSRVRKNRKPQATIQTNNKHLYNFLVNHDYKLRNNGLLILNKIPDNLKQFWYRGFLDGDGNIYFNKSNSSCQLTFASNYDQNWEFIEALYKELGIVSYTIKRQINSKGHKSSVIRTTNRVNNLKVLDYIYSNYDNIGLSRKYDTYIKIKEHKPYSRKKKLLPIACPNCNSLRMDKFHSLHCWSYQYICGYTLVGAIGSDKFKVYKKCRHKED